MIILLILLSAYETKLVIPLQPLIKSSLGSTILPVSNVYNTIYVGNISIGSEAIEQSFLFDTGSSWIWLPSNDCKSCHKPSNYNHLQSSSYKSQNKTLTIPYGNSLDVSGKLSQETFTLQSSPIPDQSFVLASQSKGFKDMQANGMIGLAFSDLSSEQDTFVQSMSKAKLIKSPTFSLYLGNNDYGRKKEKKTSSIIFGGHNLKKYSDEDFKFLDVVYTGFWSVSLTKIQVDGNSVKSSTRIAIFDSGINLMTGPPTDVLDIYTKIQKSGKCVLAEFLVCECSGLDDFPQIEFVLDSVYFSVNPEEYVYRDGKTCVVLILSNKFGVWMLGNPFLRSYYSFYDMDKKVIGLARSSEASDVRGNSSYFWTVALITLGTVSFVILIVLIRLLYLKRRRNISTPRINQESMIPLQDFNR